MAKYKDPVLDELEEKKKSRKFRTDPQEYRKWAISKFGKRMGERAYQNYISFSKEKKESESKTGANEKIEDTFEARESLGIQRDPSQNVSAAEYLEEIKRRKAEEKKKKKAKK